jgi:prevent-host-death family protein
MEIRVSITDFRAHQSELVGKAGNGGATIVIERFGVPAAALVSMADLARIYRLEADDAGALTGVGGVLVTVGRILRGLNRWKRSGGPHQVQTGGAPGSEPADHFRRRTVGKLWIT